MTDISTPVGGESTDADLELLDLQRLFDAESDTPPGGWTVRLPEKQVRWSTENHLIHGTSPETFIPTPERVLELTHPRDRPRMQAMSAAWLRDGRPFGMLARIVRPAGDVRVVEIRGWVSRDRDGKVIGAQGTTTDITELAAERRERRALSEQRGALLRDLVAAEESERARIAADLHEDTVQTLSAVSLQLSQATTGTAGEHAERAIGDAEHHVRAATMRMRFLLFELLPPVTETNLHAAVEAYCKLLFADTDISHEVLGDPQDVPIDCYLLAYRLIQGALRNALKHSEGSRVQVTIHTDGMLLTARVCDDGMGLGPGASALATDAGLGMIRRAQAAGGSAEVDTDGLLGGAAITLRLPLRFDPAAE